MSTPKPRFELTRVYDDGTYQVELYPITNLPTDTLMDRRGFLGTAITGLSVMGLLALPGTGEAAEPKKARKPKKSGCANSFAHTDKVTAIAVSPDGNFLLSGGNEGTVKLWSLPDGGLIESLENSGGSIHALAVSPDSKHVAANDGNAIKLWDLPDGDNGRTLASQAYPLYSLAFSADSTFIVSGNADHSIKLWNLPDGSLGKTLEGHHGVVNALAVSPNGQWLISGSADNTIKLWNLPEGTLVNTLDGHQGGVSALAISPDGSILASEGGDDSVKLWSLPDGGLLKTLPGHNDGVKALAISPDGKTLATGGKDNSIKLWSLPDGILTKTLNNHKDSINALAFTPDGDRLVSASDDKTVKLWSLPAGTVVVCMMDLAASPPTTKGITIKHKSPHTGKSHSYTMPCGSKIPDGAVCTCNCVPGTGYVDASDEVPIHKATPIHKKKPKAHKRTGRQPCGMKIPRGAICTCNCIPVCQAHRLTHPDAIVRTMAEEILYLMGGREFEYMRWAADNAESAFTRSRILGIMARINQGAKPNPNRWPTVRECVQRLAHSDEIIRIMAAQMLSQHLVNGLQVRKHIRGKILGLLDDAAKRPWFVRYDL